LEKDENNEHIGKGEQRADRAIESFPNERLLIRLAVVILIDINEEWLTGRRYLDIEKNSL